SVSGATYTSAGYKKSLQSALDKAAKSAAGSGHGAGGAHAPSGTGDAAQAAYGDVQRRITDGGGKISREVAGQASKGGQSDQITANAVPKLNQAAVAAGTADIDAVSGATYTSTGYQKSLQSALDKAEKEAPPASSGSSGSGGASGASGSDGAG